MTFHKAIAAVGTRGTPVCENRGLMDHITEGIFFLRLRPLYYYAEPLGFWFRVLVPAVLKEWPAGWCLMLHVCARICFDGP